MSQMPALWYLGALIFGAASLPFAWLAIRDMHDGNPDSYDPVDTLTNVTLWAIASLAWPLTLVVTAVTMLVHWHVTRRDTP